MAAFAHPGAVGALTCVGVMSMSSIWVATGEGLGVVTSSGPLAMRCPLSLPSAIESSLVNRMVQLVLVLLRLLLCPLLALERLNLFRLCLVVLQLLRVSLAAP